MPNLPSSLKVRLGRNLKGKRRNSGPSGRKRFQRWGCSWWPLQTCETPLKAKLIVSNKINEVQKMTMPKIMIQEMDTLCLPKINIIVVWQHFCCIEQEEDEQINNFETKVRSNAMDCGFSTCQCIKKCNKYNFNREEDEIKTQILCNMKDQELQKELWRKC